MPLSQHLLADFIAIPVEGQCHSRGGQRAKVLNAQWTDGLIWGKCCLTLQKTNVFLPQL